MVAQYVGNYFDRWFEVCDDDGTLINAIRLWCPPIGDNSEPSDD